MAEVTLDYTTEPPPGSDTPEAEMAREAVRGFKARWRAEHGIVDIQLDEDGEPILSDEETPESVEVIAWHRADEADLTAAPSMPKFLKLGEELGLIVQVQATRVRFSDVMYAPSSKQKGQVKTPGYETECVFITLTNLVDFAATVAWQGKTFKGALIGGQRSGYRPERWYKAINAAMTKITECFTTQLVEEDPTND